VGGKIAQIGSRLVDAAARKMADTFFARFTEAVTPDAADHTPAAEDAPAAPAGDNEPTEEPKRKRSWKAWISKS
jgi:hypothetical protein